MVGLRSRAGTFAVHSVRARDRESRGAGEQQRGIPADAHAHRRKRPNERSVPLDKSRMQCRRPPYPASVWPPQGHREAFCPALPAATTPPERQSRRWPTRSRLYASNSDSRPREYAHSIYSSRTCKPFHFHHRDPMKPSVLISRLAVFLIAGTSVLSAQTLELQRVERLPTPV